MRCIVLLSNFMHAWLFRFWYCLREFGNNRLKQFLCQNWYGYWKLLDNRMQNNTHFSLDGVAMTQRLSTQAKGRELPSCYLPAVYLCLSHQMAGACLYYVFYNPWHPSTLLNCWVPAILNGGKPLPRRSARTRNVKREQYFYAKNSSKPT